MIKISPYQELYRMQLLKMIAEFRVETARLKNREISFSTEAATEELQDYLANGYQILLALKDDAAAGFLVMRQQDDVWWVDTLFVCEKLRRRGIATALYEAAEEQTAASTRDNLFVWVHPNNRKMLAFLASRGYNVLNLIELRKPWAGERFSRQYQFEEQFLDY